eukprot:TRINITY_DN16175_c0_g4_i1.p1 TRINITY_DN16175_c0_g4~~TRINITY_DN16175_c0_g4_i1.p1  ORF type:complete len:649 (-),score=107.71 TRINITY_DN16175_c0_g4_i1:229-2175(-)
MNQFELVRVLGRGLFGNALLVKERGPGATMRVVKQVDVARLSPEERVRAQGEVARLTHLSHPNVILHLSAFIDKEYTLCAVREFVEGLDLGAIIRQRKRTEAFFTGGEPMSFTAQSLAALAYIHSEGVLHRNLECEHIILGSDGIAKLCDFGIQRLLDSPGGKAAVMEKPGHMAPEVCQGLPQSMPSDVWSVGVVLYTGLALRPPFESFNPKALINKILHTDPPPLQQDCGKETFELLQGMLMKRPENRPTAEELLTLPRVHRHLQPTCSASELMTGGSAQRPPPEKRDSAAAASLAVAAGEMMLRGSPGKMPVSPERPLTQQASPGQQMPRQSSRTALINAGVVTASPLAASVPAAATTAAATAASPEKVVPAATSGEGADAVDKFVCGLVEAGGAPRQADSQPTTQAMLPKDDGSVPTWSLRDAPPLRGMVLHDSSMTGFAMDLDPFAKPPMPEGGSAVSSRRAYGGWPGDREHYGHNGQDGNGTKKQRHHRGRKDFRDSAPAMASPLAFAGGELTALARPGTGAGLPGQVGSRPGTSALLAGDTRRTFAAGVNSPSSGAGESLMRSPSRGQAGLTRQWSNDNVLRNTSGTSTPPIGSSPPWERSESGVAGCFEKKPDGGLAMNQELDDLMGELLQREQQIIEMPL